MQERKRMLNFVLVLYQLVPGKDYTLVSAEESSHIRLTLIDDHGKAVGLGFFAIKQQMELIMQWMPFK
jgi:hypothetical protein